MDETDIRLCQMLFVNSRTPIRDLADRLNLSVQATHRRMQVLKEEGLAHSYKASLSLGYLRAIRVLVEGISQGKSDEVNRALRDDQYVSSVFIGEGQPQYFLECIIKDIKDLDSLVGHLKSEVRISNPNVLFDAQVRFGPQALDTKYTGPEKLSRLDLQIVNTIHDDARMGVGDIALKCGASVRTVTRHLDRMLDEGAIDFGIDWRPGNTSGLTAMMAVICAKDADQRFVRDELNNRFGGSLFVVTTLSNVAGLISSYAWSPSIKKYNELLDSIRGVQGVETVLSTVLKDGWVQDTWRDRLLKEEAGKPYQ